MISEFFQVVITVWLGVHPVRVTMPKLYPTTDVAACYRKSDAVEELLKSHKLDKVVRVEVGCETTDKREL